MNPIFDQSVMSGMSTNLCRDQKIREPLDGTNAYDSAQDILYSCNRDLEELRMKALKTSVRCHMLEVDLATQFSPHNQQIFTDAQASCQQCSETISSLIQKRHSISATSSLKVSENTDVPVETKQEISDLNETTPSVLDSVHTKSQPENANSGVAEHDLPVSDHSLNEDGLVCMEKETS